MDGAARAAAERGWLEPLGVAPAGRADFLAACGLDDGAAARLVEDLALEAALLGVSDRVLPDGPSWLEGLALGARLSGAWGESLSGLTSPRRRSARRAR